MLARTKQRRKRGVHYIVARIKPKRERGVH